MQMLKTVSSFLAPRSVSFSNQVSGNSAIYLPTEVDVLAGMVWWCWVELLETVLVLKEGQGIVWKTYLSFPNPNSHLSMKRTCFYSLLARILIATGVYSSLVSGVYLTTATTASLHLLSLQPA